MSNNKVKRILIFSLAYYPHVGGAEVAIKEVTDRLPSAEFEFHMVTLNLGGEARDEKVGTVWVHRVGRGRSKVSKLLFQFVAFRAAVRLHQEQPFDAVWAMMAHATGVAVALFNWRYPRVPYLLSLQEGDPIPHIERTMLPVWPLFVRAFRRARVILPLSEYLARWARTLGARGAIEIVPNAVSVADFTGVLTPHEGTILITTSRLVTKNAIDDVIRALPLLPASVQFHILGTGPEEAMLHALARTLGVESRVTFLGHIDRSVMPEYLHRADIFIRPSRSEGFGISFVEAMAAGLPVIATQEGGLADFLFDARRNHDKAPTGWAVDVNAPLQIAEAVTDILAHPEEVARVTATAKAMVIEKYDWARIGGQMQRLFDTITTA